MAAGSRQNFGTMTKPFTPGSLLPTASSLQS